MRLLHRRLRRLIRLLRLVRWFRLIVWLLHRRLLRLICLLRLVRWFRLIVWLMYRSLLRLIRLRLRLPAGLWSLPGYRLSPYLRRRGCCRSRADRIGDAMAVKQRIVGVKVTRTRCAGPGE